MFENTRDRKDFNTFDMRIQELLDLRESHDLVELVLDVETQIILSLLDGRWMIDDGGWTMDEGRWTMDDGQWSMVDGLSSMVYL